MSSPLKQSLGHVSIFSRFNWYAHRLNALSLKRAPQLAITNKSSLHVNIPAHKYSNKRVHLTDYSANMAYFTFKLPRNPKERSLKIRLLPWIGHLVQYFFILRFHLCFPHSIAYQLTLKMRLVNVSSILKKRFGCGRHLHFSQSYFYEGTSLKSVRWYKKWLFYRILC